MSTGEAEFGSASDACRDILWVRYFLEDLDLKQADARILYQDNQTEMNWGEKGVRSAKHIAMRHNFVLYNVKQDLITLQYCPTTVIIAHYLTKPLPRMALEQQRSSLGVVSTSAFRSEK